MNDKTDKISITWDEINKNDSDTPPNAAAPILEASETTAVNRKGGLVSMKIAVLSLVAIAALAVTVFWRVDIARRNDPMTTIKVIDSVATESALVKYKDYFTPKGYGLIQWMISESEQADGDPMKLSYGLPEIVGDTCQVWGMSGNTRMAIRLVRGDRWLFDDIYIATIDGREVGLLASYVRDNPIKTWFKMSWPDLLDSFIQGFLIGLSVSGE